MCSVESGSLQSPWTLAYQAPLSVEFSRQEHWSGLSFPPPRDLPDPGIEPVSPASPAVAGRFFTFEPPEKPNCSYVDPISPSGVNFISVESGLLWPPSLPGQKAQGGVGHSPDPRGCPKTVPSEISSSQCGALLTFPSPAASISSGS